MINPSDNSSLNCFVKESKFDNDYKMALYPQWSEAYHIIINQICLVKETFYAFKDENIEQKFGAHPLAQAKLNHDLSEETEKWLSEIKKVTSDYKATVTEKFNECIKSLYPRSERNLFEGRLKYIEKTQEERQKIFDSFQKSLVDRLLWEHTTLDNTREEQRQPFTANNNSTADISGGNRTEVKQLNWGQYDTITFAANKSSPANQVAPVVAVANNEYKLPGIFPLIRSPRIL